MAWCCQATSHYLNQCWPSSMSSYDITRGQWVKILPYQRQGGTDQAYWAKVFTKFHWKKMLFVWKGLMFYKSTHGGMNKMATILQMWFCIFLMENFHVYIGSNFISGCSWGTVDSQYIVSGNGLALIKQQAIPEPVLTMSPMTNFNVLNNMKYQEAQRKFMIFFWTCCVKRFVQLVHDAIFYFHIYTFHFWSIYHNFQVYILFSFLFIILIIFPSIYRSFPS